MFEKFIFVARWEIDEHYCAAVRNSKFYSSSRNRDLFLDFIDVAIFDFLISNGDRHHYEYIEKSKRPRIMVVDNGKRYLQFSNFFKCFPKFNIGHRSV